MLSFRALPVALVVLSSVAPLNAAHKPTDPSLGLWMISLADFSESLKDEKNPIKLPAIGVVIRHVSSHSSFNTANLEPGDIVYSLNEDPVTTVGDFIARLKSLKVGDTCRIKFQRATVGKNHRNATWRQLSAAVKIQAFSDTVRPVIVREKDAVDDHVFYMHRDSNKQKYDRVYAYISQSDGHKPKLVLVLRSITGRGFADSFMARIDNQKIDIKPTHGIDHDVRGESYESICRCEFEVNQLDLVQRIGQASSAVVRASGDGGNDDHEVTIEEQDRLNAVAISFQSLANP